MFPILRGGTCAISYLRRCGLNVTFEMLPRHRDSDGFVIVGCGVKDNELINFQTDINDGITTRVGEFD